MKILAKKNSQLENLIKGFYEQMESEKEEVFKMVEEFTGVKPVSFGYYWYFGITCVWAEDTWRFPENSSPNNVVLYQSNGNTYYKPNKRRTASKEFIKSWKSKFKGIDGEPLSKYGIPVTDKMRGMCYHWLPLKEGERYGIEFPSSLFDRLPKMGNKQYEILL